MEPSHFHYDVALSYSQEDHAFADSLASELRELGVTIFYDKYEMADMWGKNLYTHLSLVYGKLSRYCIMLISRHYVSGQWTAHQRAVAQARAFQENREYILPVRLDDSEVPGLEHTVSVLDGRFIAPDELALRFVEKLVGRGMPVDSNQTSKEAKGKNTMADMSSLPPFHPIIYIGDLITPELLPDGIEASPFMEFAQPTTSIRQRWTGELQRQHVDAPVLRLMREYGYEAVTEPGSRDRLSTRSIVPLLSNEGCDDEGSILRSIEARAQQLSDLILETRDRVCGEEKLKAFRVYLVAHSLGGLICRCFLQNHACGSAEARSLVEKVVTYGTPHGGIPAQDLARARRLFPGSIADAAQHFSTQRMRQYLQLPIEEPVGSLNGKFDPEKFLCIVGTTSQGLLNGKSVVDVMSDGLVRIERATVHGPIQKKARKPGRINAPRVFVHARHAGRNGLLSSDAAFQTLVRFLFGDLRVDGVLQIAELDLPGRISKLHDKGKEVRGSYQIETSVRIRGIDADVHRRTVSETSAIFRSYDDLLQKRPPHLFSLFLARSGSSAADPSIGFSFLVRIPDPVYEVDGYEYKAHALGGNLFSDRFNCLIMRSRGDPLELRYGFDSQTPNEAPLAAAAGSRHQDDYSFEIPLSSGHARIRGHVLLRVREWNLRT